MRKCWRREEVQGSRGPKDQDISNSHSNTSLTLKKVHLVFKLKLFIHKPLDILSHDYHKNVIDFNNYQKKIMDSVATLLLLLCQAKHLHGGYHKSIWKISLCPESPPWTLCLHFQNSKSSQPSLFFLFHLGIFWLFFCQANILDCEFLLYAYRSQWSFTTNIQDCLHMKGLIPAANITEKSKKNKSNNCSKWY